MKRILLALLLLPAAFCAAQSRTVTISDTGDVLVDGQNWGKPADAIANNRALAGFASDVQRAIDKARSDRVDAHAKLLSDERAAHEATKAKAAADLAAAIARATAAEQKLAGLVETLRTQPIEALSAEVRAAITNAIASETEKKRAAIAAQKAALDAELARLAP